MSANRNLNGRFWESREAAAGTFETFADPAEFGQQETFTDIVHFSRTGHSAA
jgi:hypothetical protein